MKKFLFLFFLFVIALPTIGQNIPVDFEISGNGADWVWTVFENESNPELEIIENPDPSGINPSPTVAKFTALQGGQPFAGCETLHGAGVGSFMIDESNSIIRIMVWKSVISDVGIKLVRFDNWSLGEIKIPNTKINEWEQIEFDFSAHIGNPYDQIVIFPDFNNRQSDNIIYFDEIYGEVEMTTSTDDLEKVNMSLSPNPASKILTVRSNEHIGNYEIYSITGALVDSEKTTGNNISINIADLPNGIYLMKAMSNGQAIVEKFIKE